MQRKFKAEKNRRGWLGRGREPKADGGEISLQEKTHGIPRGAARMGRVQLDETDATFLPGGGTGGDLRRDRYEYDREQVLRDALLAWRVNPLARRIVGLTTQYVVGGGLKVRSADETAHRFLTDWWQHPLNQLSMRACEWCDELTRAGELFFLISTDAGGMSYVRAVPALEIREIITASNDLQQELAYVQRTDGVLEDHRWQAYQADLDAPLEGGGYPPAMVHYAVNRPVGALRGESDLAPLLRWLSRYSVWLEDRARLNRYRNTFIFTVKARFANEAERLARQQALAANPPGPGSILVTDESEEWSVLSPKLESQEAGEDGLALKKMLSAGAGLPLHFLAEPESATRTTAEAAGGPTYRYFEQRQQFFCWMVADLARIAWMRRGVHDIPVEIQVEAADLSARDNAELAVAASTAVDSFLRLWEKGVIDTAELLRVVYRFAGEVVDLEGLLKRVGQAR